MELRPYQLEAIEGSAGYPGIDRALEENPSTLLVLPTGCGKTIVFARVIASRVAQEQRVLVVAHRQELIVQAFEKIRKTTDVNPWEMAIEMGRSKADLRRRVVVGSVQTLNAKRLRRFPSHHFDLVVIDEAHHSPAKTYGRIFKHFSTAKLLGVTATPDRLDGQGLGAVFKSLAYRYGLQDAINDEYLVPIIGRMVIGNGLDLREVRTVAGDFNQGDLARVMEAQDNLDLVAKSTVELAQERPTIVFTTSVAQAESLAQRFNLLRPGSAAAVDGKTDKGRRRRVLRNFESGRLKVLCNCSLFTEGVDVPAIACVAIARPTKSRGLYTQMVGRGTRLLGPTFAESESNGKSDLLVLDFVGASGRHKLVTSIDLFGGELSEGARKAAIERMAEGDAVPIAEAVQVAQEQLDEEKTRRSMETISYRVVSADPFALLGVARKARYTGNPATHQQLQFLAKHGVTEAGKLLKKWKAGELRPSEGFSYEHAQQLEMAIHDRQRRGLCTLRMARQLAKRKLNPDCSFHTGKWAMTILAKNKWRPTKALLEHPELNPQPKGGRIDAS